MITKDIKVKHSGQWSEYLSFPLIAGDILAYRIVLDTPYQLDGADFFVSAIRHDKSIVTDMGEINGKTATYVLKNNMYSQPNEVILRLALHSKDGSVLTSKQLICPIEDATGESDFSGDDRVPLLNGLIYAAERYANDAYNYAQDAKDHIHTAVEEAMKNAEYLVSEAIKGAEYLASDATSKWEEMMTSYSNAYDMYNEAKTHVEAMENVREMVVTYDPILRSYVDDAKDIRDNLKNDIYKYTDNLIGQVNTALEARLAGGSIG